MNRKGKKEKKKKREKRERGVCVCERRGKREKGWG